MSRKRDRHTRSVFDDDYNCPWCDNLILAICIMLIVGAGICEVLTA